MVSVIVPVYNVEKYLRQCLDSLKEQTLGDVEFIVIDDGSTDGSGEICDEYAEDSRFRVFHTENHGLSAARNRGLDEARGEWIEFVDSDDWVEPGFCEIPLKAVRKYQSDMAIFCFEKVTEKGKRTRRKKREKVNGYITKEKAIDFGGLAAWNKIYKRSLFSNIRYPEDHLYEDIAITHKLIYSACSIVALPDILIRYRIRKNSLSRSKHISSEKDRFSFQIQRFSDLTGEGYPEEKAKRYCSMRH